jgi:hypothetical protein
VAKKQGLTDREYAGYRHALSLIESNIHVLDNNARDRHYPKSTRDEYGCERDGWIVARDALLKVVRREQERRME